MHILRSMFKRKVYESLIEWKNKYASYYACLLEGNRCVENMSI